jgi:Protein of unknown function (DUF2855)
MLELQISKQNLRWARIGDTPNVPLASGDARLKLDLFALTGNNITYAAMGGPPLGYWDFFPGTNDWGRPPCWGFATVTQSSATGVEVGARYYGYFPIASALDVTPQNAGPRGFADGAPHRSAKAASYNQYLDVAADPAYAPAFESEQALFRPLYATGWWAADELRQGSLDTVVVSSASSKVALSLAHQLRRLGGVELVALTSMRNEAYVRETGLYDRTVTYDAIATLAAARNAVYVDILGRDDVIAAAHRALGSALHRSLLIGATDWADKSGDIQPRIEVGGPKPEFFFMPAYRAGRLKAQPELAAAVVQDMRAFYQASRHFVSPLRESGGAAILETWRTLAAGTTRPREGHVLSF